MKTIKVSEATPGQLDWLVAKCLGESEDETLDPLTWLYTAKPTGCWDFCTNWAQGGPIIEREAHNLFKHNGGTEWCCACNVPRDGYTAIVTADGPTPLIAAMRCYVASKLGDTAEVPEELA